MIKTQLIYELKVHCYNCILRKYCPQVNYLCQNPYFKFIGAETYIALAKEVDFYWYELPEICQDFCAVSIQAKKSYFGEV